MWCYQPQRRSLALFALYLTYPADFTQVEIFCHTSMDSSREYLLNALINTAGIQLHRPRSRRCRGPLTGGKRENNDRYSHPRRKRPENVLNYFPFFFSSFFDCAHIQKWITCVGISLSLIGRPGKTGGKNVVRKHFKGKNSSSICCATFLVYFLRRASTAVREMMEQGGHGFDARRLSHRERKNGISHVQEPVKLTHYMLPSRRIFWQSLSTKHRTKSLTHSLVRATRALQSHSNTEKSHRILGIKSGFLAYFGKYVSFSGGECGGRTFRLQKLG